MKFNYGSFRNGIYTKRVMFSKAVIWKDRQLSLREEIIDRIRTERIELIVFVDEYKNERWIFKVDKVLETMVKKSVGQEVQYYFPIELAKRVQIVPTVKPKVIFDDSTGIAYVGVDHALPQESKTVQTKKDPQIALL